MNGIAHMKLLILPSLGYYRSQLLALLVTLARSRSIHMVVSVVEMSVWRRWLDFTEFRGGLIFIMWHMHLDLFLYLFPLHTITYLRWSQPPSSPARFFEDGIVNISVHVIIDQMIDYEEKEKSNSQRLK